MSAVPSLSTVHRGTCLTALQRPDKHSTALSAGLGTSHTFSNDNAQWIYLDLSKTATVTQISKENFVIFLLC